MYVSSLKNIILNGLYSCVQLDVYTPEITHSQYLSMYLPKQADSTESFTSQKSSLTSSWNLSREKLKKKRLSPDSNIGEKEKDKDNRISKRLTDHGEFSNRNRKSE